jgi:hypothetical protein
MQGPEAARLDGPGRPQERRGNVAPRWMTVPRKGTESGLRRPRLRHALLLYGAATAGESCGEF